MVVTNHLDFSIEVRYIIIVFSSDNFNTVPCKQGFQEMIATFHNKIRASIQQAPICDGSLFDNPMTEEVPLQAFTHFEYLNEASQR